MKSFRGLTLAGSTGKDWPRGFTEHRRLSSLVRLDEKFRQGVQATFLPKVFTRRGGIVFASVMGTFVNPTPTVNTVFSLFLIPIATEFHWPRSSVSAALLVVAVTSALSYPLIGRLADRYGVRPIVLIGNVLFAASVALLAFTRDSHVQFYLTYALVGMTGATLGPILFTKVIAGWFDETRGFFLGVMGGVGNGAGATFMPIYVHWLITAYGWRGAYAGIGLAIFVIGFPILLALLRDPPQDKASVSAPKAAAAEAARPEEGLTLDEAWRTGTFWMILIAIALGAGSVTAVFTHVVPILLDRGLPFGQATAVLSVFALVTVVWQIGMGLLLDRFPRPRIAAPFYLVAVIGVLLLETTSSYPLLLLSGALMGIGLGTEYGVLPYFISRYFGLKAYGAISGVMYATVTLVLGTTPMLMDLVFDVTGTYRIAMGAIALGLVGGAVLLARLQPFAAVLSRGAVRAATTPAA